MTECDCGKRMGQLTCPICSEVGKSMNSEQFDKEFDLESTVNKIVENAKAEVKARYGNKRRHRQ